MVETDRKSGFSITFEFRLYLSLLLTDDIPLSYSLIQCSIGMSLRMMRCFPCFKTMKSVMSLGGIHLQCQQHFIVPGGIFATHMPSQQVPETHHPKM
jgi:hypothetical protein